MAESNLRREPECEPTIDDDVFRQAAVAVDGDDFLPNAQLLSAPPAEGTFETRLLLVPDTDTITRMQVGDVGACRFDDANDFVARDQWEPSITPGIVDELDVAPRQASMRDPHENVCAAE